MGKRCALTGGNGLRGDCERAKREGVHLHDEDPARVWRTQREDRKDGVKGWTIFSPPVKRYRREYPIAPSLFSEIKPTVGQYWSCSKS